MEIQESLEELISEERKHRLYSIRDYAAYCREIRQRLWNQPDAERFRNFLEKKFVEEMKPLSKICTSFFAGKEEEVIVQYVQHDPPDGRITFRDLPEEICVEITTAKDKRLEQYCLEQNRLGNFTSSSGHTSIDIVGSRHKGYKLAGNPVEAECLEETMEKQLKR